MPDTVQCALRRSAYTTDSNPTEATFTLNYPLESWKSNYKPTTYQQNYMLPLTAHNKTRIAALSDRFGPIRPDRVAIIMRVNQDSPWQIFSDISVCPRADVPAIAEWTRAP